MSDLRDKNIEFSMDSPKKYALEYFASMSETFKQIDFKDLPVIIERLNQVIQSNSVVYSMGNGGSAAITDHLVCDFTKGCFTEHTKLKTFSLNSNVPLLTAVSNDFSYEDSFKKQLEFYGNESDIVIAISSSGNSENIVRAINYAKSKNMTTISFTGFNGGMAKTDADLNIHVPTNNYGVVEDIHQSIMHIIAQYIYLDHKK